MTTPACPYCNEPSQLVTGKEVYPHMPKFNSKQLYLCSPCQAWVGCHPGTIIPLGRLADLQLRKLKQAAHAAFDRIWRKDGLSRSQAYIWLASKLNIHPAVCHIGMFDIAQCTRVVRICNAYRALEQVSCEK